MQKVVAVVAAYALPTCVAAAATKSALKARNQTTWCNCVNCSCRTTCHDATVGDLNLVWAASVSGGGWERDASTEQVLWPTASRFMEQFN
jgi:hypothetical protein